MVYKEDVGLTVEHKLCWALQYLDNVLEQIDDYVAFNTLTRDEQRQVRRSVISIRKLKHSVSIARAKALTSDLDIWLG